MIFRCENPEADWIQDLREIERDRDINVPEPQGEWTDPELWAEDEE